MITATFRIAAQIQQKTQLEARVCVPGHMLRGGSPSAYDRILATQFGVYAAQLIKEEHYGMTVAKVGGTITANPLAEIAGKTKFVTPDDQLVATDRNLGISFGDLFFIQANHQQKDWRIQKSAPVFFCRSGNFFTELRDLIRANPVYEDERWWIPCRKKRY